MSDDETGFDGMDPNDGLTPEDIFKMVLINKIRKTKTTISLQDKDGDIVEISDVTEGLITYIKDKMEDTEGNDFADQIFPLMTQAAAGGMARLLGIQATGFYLANEGTRHAIIYMMCVGFLLLKYIQQHELLINTTEEPITDDEIDEMDRRAKASSAAAISTVMGLDPREILNALVDQGLITEDDVQSIIGKRAGSDDEENDDGEEE